MSRMWSLRQLQEARQRLKLSKSKVAWEAELRASLQQGETNIRQYADNLSLYSIAYIVNEELCIPRLFQTFNNCLSEQDQLNLLVEVVKNAQKRI